LVKILRLIKNEWRKELSKVATWVTVGILALCAVLSVLSGWFTSLHFSVFGEMPFEEFCENEIAWNEEMLLSGKDDEESLNFYRVQIEAYRIMLDAEMGWEDWRYTQGLADMAAEAKYSSDTVAYTELLDVINSNDPAKYFTWQKKTYTELYAYDAERLEIYVSMMDFCIENDVIPYAAADWRYGQVTSVIEHRDTVLTQERLQASGGAWSESVLENARNEAAIAEYRLSHNVRINPADSFKTPDWSVYSYEIAPGVYTSETSLYWDAMKDSAGVLEIASLITLIVAGGIVANEFSAGTIKFLLMAPVRRWKILLSKYAMVLTFAMGLCVLVLLVSLGSALPLGVADALLPAVFARSGEVYTVSPYLLVLGDYGIAFLKLVVMATLAFALSALTRKASAAIGVTVFLDLMGGMIASLLQVFGFDWGRYFLFSNLDLSAIAEGTALFPHQSLGTAILIIVLHMTVFLLTAHDAFVRREV